jgi:cytosine/adenosine deaminase-related metal-dependent hydrolase
VSSILLRNATILTMNDRMDVVNGAVSVRDGRIVWVGAEPRADLKVDPYDPGGHDVTIDASGHFLLPGFIQTHIHLCQTLFRGYADDLRLMEWLRTRIWPMEAAHTPATLRAAARLACLELLRSGTTSILTMETVHDTDAVIEATAGTGIRATLAKCLMDETTPDAPARLRENGRAALDESLALSHRYHGTANGRIRIAFAPRFALSCSRQLLEAVAATASDLAAIVHTHASEQQDEVAMVRDATGLGNIEYFDTVGLLSPRLNIAHCVWVDDEEQAMMARHQVKVTHCPGSNIKLGSGIAPVPEMRSRGLCVSLGADGAACNNHLDMFGEMRLAAGLQSIRHSPGALSARDALWMATRAGAAALGLDAEIGSIEAGKRADLILIDAMSPQMAPSPDPFSAIAYAAHPGDVRLTMVDGEILVRDGAPLHLDAAEIAAEARSHAAELARRAL